MAQTIEFNFQLMSTVTYSRYIDNRGYRAKVYDLAVTASDVRNPIIVPSTVTYDYKWLEHTLYLPSLQDSVETSSLGGHSPIESR